ncbi:MAG: hypothetical protein R2849_18655 [Thermomicrobiales bacterium]
MVVLPDRLLQVESRDVNLSIIIFIADNGDIRLGVIASDGGDPGKALFFEVSDFFGGKAHRFHA